VSAKCVTRFLHAKAPHGWISTSRLVHSECSSRSSRSSRWVSCSLSAFHVLFLGEALRCDFQPLPTWVNHFLPQGPEQPKVFTIFDPSLPSAEEH
jgi:hypothetical protein